MGRDKTLMIEGGALGWVGEDEQEGGEGRVGEKGGRVDEEEGGGKKR